MTLKVMGGEVFDPVTGVGDGHLHYDDAPPANARTCDFVIEHTVAINRIVHDLVDELGGSISAEHGIGQWMRDEWRRYKRPLELEMMRAIKQVLDPQGLMNLGKIL